jgi:hypothetical protein
VPANIYMRNDDCGKLPILIAVCNDASKRWNRRASFEALPRIREFLTMPGHYVTGSDSPIVIK